LIPVGEDDSLGLKLFHRLRFILIHIITLVGCSMVEMQWDALCLCAILYLVRMFGVTAGYHRYFSHRSFKTSRPFAFFLGFLAQSSAQRGILWWASNHRHHHRYSDRIEDLHSPVQHSFIQSHFDWIFHPQAHISRRNIADLTRIPELRLLNKYWLLSPILLGGFCLWLGEGYFFYGFMLSTVLLFHGTFTINSLSHMWGSRRYQTKDDSRNNWVLALITLGEGWHNNHHHYMHSTRQGFMWWEIDITFYILWLCSKLGLVWDLRTVPQRVRDQVSK
jgi:stearoyl-CoA desaturase (Delta-9 desaturase)